jgi:hypothetical protein
VDKEPDGSLIVKVNDDKPTGSAPVAGDQSRCADFRVDHHRQRVQIDGAPGEDQGHVRGKVEKPAKATRRFSSNLRIQGP